MAKQNVLEPLSDRDWSPAHAAHLLARAGFGGSPTEIERLAAMTPAKAVDQLVHYDAISESFDPPTWLNEKSDLRPDRSELRRLSDEERQMKLREYRQIEREQLIELRAWWLYRMRYTQRPLQEKLTLFWHGHFATSSEKVRSTFCLYRQNETFRTRASGSWGELVTAVAQDPAMLLYLDNAQSRASSPNENFARELMELFTLGEGHYTEEDIKAAARAFTGWTLAPGRFQFLSANRLHDGGSKSFFGERGAFGGDDIIRIILRRPQADAFIASKLWTFFAQEDPTPELAEALGSCFRTGRQMIKPFLRTLFLSQAFYEGAVRGSQVKSPVQWLISTCRALEAPLPGPFPCSAILNALGQELFTPPNVKGWDGGLTWISTTRLFHRYNLAMLLLQGGASLRDDLKGGLGTMALRASQPILNPSALLTPALRASRADAQRLLEWRLFQRPLRIQDAEANRAYLASRPEPSKWNEADLAEVLIHFMRQPQFQLC